MTTFNRDLSPIDQARLVLRNYDKVVAERDELKKENERLNKVIEQKDVLYRNMFARMEEKNNLNTIEGEYKRLQKQYDKLNEECKKLEGARFSVEVVRQVCGTLKAFSKRLRKAGLNIDDIEALFEEETDSKEIIYKVSESVYDKQAQNFISYVRDVIDVWHKTDSLRGISLIATRYGVKALTKENFFVYGLNKEDIDDAAIAKVYENIKKR